MSAQGLTGLAVLSSSAPMATSPLPGVPPSWGAGMPQCCPACGGGLSVTRLTCDDCSTEVSGRFGRVRTAGAGRGPALDPAAVRLLEALVECRNDVTAVAQRLRTGQAELDERLAALGRRLAGQAPSEADGPPFSFGDHGPHAGSAEPTTSLDSDSDRDRRGGRSDEAEAAEADRAGAEHALLHRLAAELAALDDAAPPAR